MAREIETIERQVGINPIQLPKSSAGEQVIQALQNIGGQAAEIGERAMTEHAAIQGMLDREAGKETKLAPGINRVTAAYNQAYRDTDARLVSSGALKQINQSVLDNLNPQNLNEQSALTYQSQVQGIIEGTLTQTLPENRSRVTQLLENAAMVGENKVQTAVFKLAENTIESNYKTELGNYIELGQTAALSQDPILSEEAAQLKSAIKNSYQSLSASVSARMDSDFKKADQEILMALPLGQYIELSSSADTSLTDKFVADFAANKPDYMTYPQWVDARDKLNGFHKQFNTSLSNERATNKQNIINRFFNPEVEDPITTSDEALAAAQATGLSGLQIQQVMGKWYEEQTKQREKTNSAQNIAMLRANGMQSYISNSDRDKFFMASVQQRAQEAGQMPSLDEQFDIVKSLGTDVPSFTNNLNEALTIGGNPVQLVSAGKFYAGVMTDKTESLVPLSEDALAVVLPMARTYQLTGELTEDFARSSYETYTKKVQGDVTDLVNVARTEWNDKDNNILKDAIGIDADNAKNSGIYDTAKRTYIALRYKMQSREDATEALKMSLRSVGTSKLFRKNTVGVNAPEKVMPEYEGTKGINNQYVLQAVQAVELYNKGLPENEPPMVIESVINIPENYTEEQFLTDSFVDNWSNKRKLTASQIAASPAGQVLPRPFFIPEDVNVHVSIGGKKGAIKLQPNYGSLAVKNARAAYPLIIEYNDGSYDLMQDGRTIQEQEEYYAQYGLLPTGYFSAVFKNMQATAPETIESNSRDMETSRIEQAIMQDKLDRYDDYIDEQATNLALKTDSLVGRIAQGAVTRSAGTSAYKNLYKSLIREQSVNDAQQMYDKIQSAKTEAKRKNLILKIAKKYGDESAEELIKNLEASVNNGE